MNKTLLYEHQQKQHEDLVEAIDHIPKEFHSLPFHYWGTEMFTIQSITDEARDLLWHQRLIHCRQHTLKDLHRHVNGIPNLSKTKFNDLTHCATCLKANLTKASSGHKSLRESLSVPYQGLYIDFGFAGRVSKDADGKVKESSRVDIEGLNDEQAWILISDGKTRMLHGDTRLTKASPLKYLESFLKEYSPECKNKWVVMDNGDKLYSNPKIWNIFATFGYEIYSTIKDSSNQNRPVEQAHCAVSQGIKALLFRAGLDVKFWFYAFIHVLRIRNALPG